MPDGSSALKTKEFAGKWAKKCRPVPKQKSTPKGPKNCAYNPGWTFIRGERLGWCFECVSLSLKVVNYLISGVFLRVIFLYQRCRTWVCGVHYLVIFLDRCPAQRPSPRNPSVKRAGPDFMAIKWSNRMCSRFRNTSVPDTHKHAVVPYACLSSSWRIELPFSGWTRWAG